MMAPTCYGPLGQLYMRDMWTGRAIFLPHIVHTLLVASSGCEQNEDLRFCLGRVSGACSGPFEGRSKNRDAQWTQWWSECLGATGGCPLRANALYSRKIYTDKRLILINNLISFNGLRVDYRTRTGYKMHLVGLFSL
jgi:hypothetical protein